MSSITKKDVDGIYDAFKRTFISESCKERPLPVEKRKKAEDKLGDSIMGSAEKGPEKVDGFKAPEEENKKVKKTRKLSKESINTRMSINNLFDKLFEEVMDDEEALGIESDGGDEFEFGDEDSSDESGDEVTFSLPRDLAQALCDALQGQLGVGEDDEFENDEFEFGDEGEEEGDDELGSPFPEAVESQAAPDGVAKLTGKHNKVGNLPTSSGQGDGKYTDKVGEDGDLGHSIISPKKGKGGKEDHGNMKVKTRRPGAPGSHAFSN
jgi:hypothetical protein